ncbi:hypothetical protein ACF068_05975 [Streptomyces sp. NPDC016309]|uniref:hypothetical protein n=1 Tax=Streptomyces sp. NPDC016309 TaxID=3364965 RepID=UPI00370229FB
MDDKRLEGAGEDGPGVPRDLPDEQASGGSDHWDPDLAQAQEAGDEERGSAEDTPTEGAPEEPTG